MDLNTMIFLGAAALYKQELGQDEDSAMSSALRKSKKLWLKVCTDKSKV
jgi:hypothetical protein